jgi:hypothetical protein
MRSERIGSIIERRKPLADSVDKVHGNLNQTLEPLKQFCSQCRTILQNEEIPEVAQIYEDSARLAGDSESLRGDLERLYNRFSRNTLNIAVIGRARQGKSRLLQTITGLSTEEIPDGNLQFCTGVRSDIVNDPQAEDAYARVHFLPESRFMQENIIPYFDELQKYLSNFARPTTVYDFKDIPLPEAEPLKVTPEEATQIALHLQHLKDLQEHLPEYQNFLGKSPQSILRGEIREYVAQDNKEGKRVFFKHMAVDKVEIFCRFPNSDVGKLRLIDLPGLGDTRIGDVERVVKALSDQVDLVFFLSKPSNTGAGWQDNEVHLYSQARKALGEKLPIERWAFWVFNHDKHADNALQCKTLKDTMDNAHINVSGTVIVDCTDPDEVSKKLIDAALDYLSDKVGTNDHDYAVNVQNRLNETVKSLNDLMNRAQNFLDQEGNVRKGNSKFNELYGKLWNVKSGAISLPGAIEAFVSEGSELRSARENPCTKLEKEITSILKEEKEHWEITEEDIKNKALEARSLATAYDEFVDELRTKLSKRLRANLDATLEDILREMKDKLCLVLGKAGRLEKRFGTDGVSDHRLLEKMAAFIDDEGHAEECPTLREGIMLVKDWTMSYRSFIQHRIRSALNALDPKDAEYKRRGYPTTEKGCLESLQDRYLQTLYELDKVFVPIYPEPNKAAFAVAEEFKDVMIRSFGTEKHTLDNQWRAFYDAICADVWPEEYDSSDRRNEMFKKLREPVHNLIMLCDPANFNFLK